MEKEKKYNLLFSVVANYTGGGNYAQAAELEWSPATRFVDNVNGETIVIYESASSFGSGLDLFDNDGEAPKSLRITSISSWNMGRKRLLLKLAVKVKGESNSRESMLKKNLSLLIIPTGKATRSHSLY